VGPSLERTAALLVLAGIGGGVYETVLNAAAIERYAQSSVRTLSVMHSGATLGAMLTPFGVGLALAHGDWTTAFRAVGAAHLVLAVLALGVPLGVSAGGGARRAVPSAPLVFLFVAAFAYIGVESSITAFAVPYATDGLGLDADRGRGAISVFWLGLLVGRLFFALRAGIDDARPAVAAGALAGAALAAGAVLSWTQIELLLGAVGLALGGVFPLLVALGGRRAPAAGTGVAVIAGLGSAGGFATPWATGLVGDAAGIAAAFGSLAAWLALVAVAALLADRAHAR
jgi:fucose permease